MRFTILEMMPALMIAAGAPDKDDVESIQGTWVATSMQIKIGNVWEPSNSDESSSLDFRGDRWVVRAGDFKLGGTYKLDSTKKPKTIRLELDPETPRLEKIVFNNNPKEHSYLLDGDTLIVFTPPQQQKGTTETRTTYKRMKSGS